MRYVLPRALLAAVVLGAICGGASMISLSNTHCGGPACSGLIVVPIVYAIIGTAVGLFGGAIFFWLRKRRPLVDLSRQEPNDPSQ